MISPDEVSIHEQEQFLELVREGHNRPAAARLVNPRYTGHLFRSLCRKDSYFREAYEQAVDAQREARADRILELWDEKLPDSERLLLEAANTWLPERAYVRKQKLELEGADGGPVQFVVRSAFADSDVGSAVPGDEPPG